jgi:hypothetical protein
MSKKTDLVKVEYEEQNLIVQQNTEATMKWLAAFKEIRDRKLYLCVYKNLDEYITNELPVGLSKAYALLGPSPDKQRDKIGKTTPRRGVTSPSLPSDEHYSDVLVVFDQEGRQVPAELAKLFDGANRQADAIRQAVIALNAVIIAQIKDDDKAWKHFNRSKVMNAMKDIKAFIKFSRPWAWCPTCGSDGQFGQCGTCKGTGWLIHTQWSTIPEDQK